MQYNLLFSLMIITMLIIIILLLIIIYSIFSTIKTIQSNENIKKESNNTTAYLLLIPAAIFILFSFYSPFFFTENNFNFNETGAIGDTIGGLMNPFIAIAGVIVTGLAFYVQYKANIQQRELFEVEQKENKDNLQNQINNQEKQIQEQKFESQFFEMLKLHRENITEMKINGYDFEENPEPPLLTKYEKSTEGRKIFVVMKTEFECILKLHSKIYSLDRNNFQKCYKIFFSGIDEYAKTNSEDDELIKLLRQARSNHENPYNNMLFNNKSRKESIANCQLHFNYTPFSGHSQRLGHYFRHLYLTVKSVAKSKFIEDYDEKMKYLKIMRAQLSNHEQILLFYNWLSEYGNGWENGTHSFFTEYCMIHNLWYHDLYQDKYITDKVEFLRKKETKLRTGPMFELD